MTLTWLFPMRDKQGTSKGQISHLSLVGLLFRKDPQMPNQIGPRPSRCNRPSRPTPDRIYMQQIAAGRFHSFRKQDYTWKIHRQEFSISISLIFKLEPPKPRLTTTYLTNPKLAKKLLSVHNRIATTRTNESTNIPRLTAIFYLLRPTFQAQTSRTRFFGPDH